MDELNRCLMLESCHSFLIVCAFPWFFLLLFLGFFPFLCAITDCEVHPVLVVPVLVRDSVLEMKIYGTHVRRRLPSNIWFSEKNGLSKHWWFPKKSGHSKQWYYNYRSDPGNELVIYGTGMLLWRWYFCIFIKIWQKM